MIHNEGGSRGKFWRYVVVLIVVVAGGLGVLTYLLLSTPLATVTVSGGTVTFEEGQGAQGWWFSPPTRTVGGAGYPLTLSGGGTFEVPVNLANSDSASHNVTSVEVAAPFALVSSSVPLPATVSAHADSSITLTLKAPTSAGTFAFNLTIVCAS